MFFFINNLHEKKNILERQDRRNFESVRVLFVICTRVTREYTNFQPIRSASFFMHIINTVANTGVSEREHHFQKLYISQTYHVSFSIAWQKRLEKKLKIPSNVTKLLPSFCHLARPPRNLDRTKLVPSSICFWVQIESLPYPLRDVSQ